MRLLRRTTLCVVAVIAGLCASAAVAHAQTVASTTTVSVSPDPTLATQTATLTAVVTGTGGTPTGTVQFTRNGAPIGQAPLVNGSAQLSVNAGRRRQLDVRAAYSGDGSFDPSTGNVRWNVRQANTVDEARELGEPGRFGRRVRAHRLGRDRGRARRLRDTWSSAVDGIPFDRPIPLDGYDGVRLTSSGTRRVPRACTFSATYSGDANTNPSSASLIQQVAGPPHRHRPRHRHRHRHCTPALQAQR